MSDCCEKTKKIPTGIVSLMLTKHLKVTGKNMVSAGYIHKCNSLPIPFHEHLPPPGAADAMMEQHMLSFFF